MKELDLDPVPRDYFVWNEWGHFYVRDNAHHTAIQIFGIL